MDRLDSYILYYVVVNTVLMINIQVSQKIRPKFLEVPKSSLTAFSSFSSDDFKDPFALSVSYPIDS